MLKSIRTILQQGRKKRCLTQLQVAEKLGIPLRSYQHYEYEERKMPLRIATELSILLDVDIYELSGRNSTPNDVTA